VGIIGKLNYEKVYEKLISEKIIMELNY